MERCDPVRGLGPAVLLALLVCGVFPARCQTATQSLPRKAHALAQGGRMDHAALTWQPILPVDSEDPEARAGLARAAKVEARPGMRDERPAELEAAARWAALGQYTQAMRLYRAVFGDRPPDGAVGLAYYETEGATEPGRAHAVAGLRGLAGRFPGEARYRIALARILTYDPKTRAEGRRVLARYPRDDAAVEALRQALVWDAGNPASAGDLQAYLAVHPDAQLEAMLPRMPAPALAEVERPVGVVRAKPSDEQMAARDLQSGNLGQAERLFRAALARRPSSGRALAGMGYVRMQQGDFAAAISFLAQARQQGMDDASLVAALDDARFWSTLGEGMGALARGKAGSAAQQYEAAVALRPGSPEALDGLGRALLAGQHGQRALEVYGRFTQTQPSTAAAWRGLVQAQMVLGDAGAVLATDRMVPWAVHARLMSDPGFVGTVVAAYKATGRDGEARRLLDDALDLPFPRGGRELAPAAQGEYARLLLEAGRLEQAEGLYRQVLGGEPRNSSGWAGLLEVQHAEGRDDEARETLEGISAGLLAEARHDPELDVAAAKIFVARGELDRAESVLKQAMTHQKAAGESVSVGVEVELAGVYLRRNRLEEAAALYGDVVAAHPERVDGWKGVVAALHAGGRDREALARVQQMTPTVTMGLENDPEYLLTVAEVHRGLGQAGEEGVWLGRLLEADRLHGVAPGVGVEMENVRILLEVGDEARLYTGLRRLGARADLSEEQRRGVETIWVRWAVMRAARATLAGDRGGALALLDAAGVLAGDRTALRLVAKGYTAAGAPGRAVVLYRRIGLGGATADEYQTALTAALAAEETRQAEIWARQGMAAYPRDARLLVLAARVEQTRGSGKRAAELYRAALAATSAGGASPGSLVSGPGGSAESAKPGVLAMLLAPAGGWAAGDSPASPPVSPAATLFPAGSADRVGGSGRPSPRLRDYVPSSGAGLPVRQVGVSREGGGGPERDRGGDARGATDTVQGTYVAYVSSSPRGLGESVGFRQMAQAQTDAGRVGQSHPPEDDAGFPAGAGPTGTVMGGPMAATRRQGSPVRSTDPAAMSSSMPGSEPAGTAANVRPALLEGSYRGSTAALGVGLFRAGAPGLDRLTEVETPVKFSAALARKVRAAGVPRGVFLNAGTVDSRASWGAMGASVPGTRVVGAGTSRQVAHGLGGEAQLVTSNFGVGRARCSPVAHGATPTGRHVVNNTAFEAAVSGDVRLHRWGRAETLGLGAAPRGSYFEPNERDWSYGQEGYFSPNCHLASGAPGTDRGAMRTNSNSGIAAEGGLPSFWERAAPYCPLDSGLQVGALAASIQVLATCAVFPIQGSAGGQSGVEANWAYRFADRRYLGGIVSATDRTFYEDVSKGFFVRSLFRPQMTGDGVRTGLMPAEGFLSLRVP